MTVVARRYLLSDVGLRKICIALNVPMPGRGYWARIAAGQKIQKSALPPDKGTSTYTRKIRTENANIELDEKIAQHRASVAKAPVLTDRPCDRPVDNAVLGKEAAQIAKSVARLIEENGAISLMYRAWADVSVSPGAMPRVLQLLNQLARLIHAAGGTFHISHSPESMKPPPPFAANRDKTDRDYFEFHGSSYFVRVKERIAAEELPETVAPKPARPGRPRLKLDNFYQTSSRKNLRYIPSGKLNIAVFAVRSSYDVVRAEDTVSALLEDKVASQIQRLEALALQSKIKAEILQEKIYEQQRNAALWTENKARKDVLLRQLAEFEALSSRLDRAESLRRLCEKINASPDAPAALKENVLVMYERADWLDPLVKKPWPEVDSVPDKSPFSLY